MATGGGRQSGGQFGLWPGPAIDGGGGQDLASGPGDEGGGVEGE